MESSASGGLGTESPTAGSRSESESGSEGYGWHAQKEARKRDANMVYGLTSLLAFALFLVLFGVLRTPIDFVAHGAESKPLVDIEA